MSLASAMCRMRKWGTTLLIRDQQNGSEVSDNMNNRLQWTLAGFKTDNLKHVSVTGVLKIYYDTTFFWGVRQLGAVSQSSRYPGVIYASLIYKAND